ncbi:MULTISPECIES: hypothetical protein [Sphaerochaeta]|uniref:Zinc-or iron-chelating protein n=1 Tax=Sphaerochaeta associata TaxID=1129264 RepID=A0ABY4DA83_9SPIR|nr:MULTISPECIES: hypothetical protein [Sphaerochaeta]MDT3359602.1 hypothetical protein [Spirochaetota bacterium]NLA98418.1 hypothetical protein [Spirochaetales bacterium]MDD2394191.1 hypothetical protein [Sphaerochaeta sp.]MDD3423940.1 hypothetical protein [Sphaerochaeta sp.]MDD3456549.1 hypothetical protein [Sphaerochaeta sp.]
MGKCWEDKCTKCGLCCHEKAVYGRNLVIDLDSWCEFFDPATKQCKVYSERFVRCARCQKMTRLRAMFASYLPETCGYVAWARKHHLRFAERRFIRFIHSKTCPSEDSDEPLYDTFRA